MTSLVLLATLIQSEPQITLDLPATRLTEIAKKISEQTGEQVKITGPDPGQFVFIKVEKMPFSRFRESLAYATGGKWTKAGEVWALQTVDVADLAREPRLKEIGRLKRALAQDPKEMPSDLDGSLNHIKALTQEARRVYTPELQPTNYDLIIRLQQTRIKVSPLDRFARDLFAELSPNELLKIGFGEQRVFSSHPARVKVQPCLPLSCG